MLIRNHFSENIIYLKFMHLRLCSLNSLWFQTPPSPLILIYTCHSLALYTRFLNFGYVNIVTISHMIKIPNMIKPMVE